MFHWVKFSTKISPSCMQVDQILLVFILLAYCCILASFFGVDGSQNAHISGCFLYRAHNAVVRPACCVRWSCESRTLIGLISCKSRYSWDVIYMHDSINTWARSTQNFSSIKLFLRLSKLLAFAQSHFGGKYHMFHSYHTWARVHTL